MLKIGDFSALSQVSIKTLRYYDETGLLRPPHIDPENGYRYYPASQLSQLHRILARKDFGFSLEEIAQALKAGISAEQMRGMLLLRQAEQRKRVEGRKRSPQQTRACQYYLGRQRREPDFPDSRSEERRILNIFERRATTKPGKFGPSLRVAAKSRDTSMSSWRVVPPCAADSASSGAIFARNAARPK